MVSVTEMLNSPRFPFGLRSLLVVSAVALLAGCASPAPKPDATTTSLAQLMVQRLAIADQVAWVKYQNGAPVLDPVREKQVMDRVVSEATAAGIDPQLAARFFEAQMRASRIRQQELITKWSQGALLPTWGPLSLKDDIRPVLDQITIDLINELKGFPDSASSRRSLAKALSDAGYGRSVVRAATRF